MACFVAFYSYKGGVGRTLALANVAYSLAMRGKRVVVIDMDLEAPALLGFPQFALKGKAPKKGFLEYAASYRRRGICPSVNRYVHECRESPGTGKLWVMPSGRIDGSYQQTLASLSWRCLHPRKGTPPLAEGLQRALVEEFKPHYVLIDSRTGLSDVGGLSTHLLADMIVLIFNLTPECIEGSIRAYRAFSSEKAEVRTMHLVASPIPPVVPSKYSLIEERIRQAKEHMPGGAVYGRDVIRIFYDPSMALSKELAVLKPENYAASEKYEKLREAIQRSNREEIFPVVEEARRRRDEGRWEEGLMQLQEFVEAHPDDAEGQMELGNYLLETDRAEEASRCFSTATKLAGDLAIAHRRLGEALVAADKVNEAVGSLEKAHELGDESREVFEALATAYSKVDDKTHQNEAQRKALEAQRKALSATLKNLGNVPFSGDQEFQDLRREFIATLGDRPPYSNFNAQRTWELLTASQALTAAQKHGVARALLDGKLTISQIVDMIRLLRKEEEGRTADLEIRITTEDVPNGTSLRYVLHSPGGRVRYIYHIVGETIIRDTLAKYQARFLHEVQNLAQSLSSDGSALLSQEIEQELEALGHELYYGLFPKELKIAYREFRDQVNTLLIISDECCIPWELVKPFDDEIDDDFLCCRFEFTRWLAGEVPPAAVIDAQRIACIEAGSPFGSSVLPHAAKESHLFTGLGKRHSGVESLIVSDATYAQVDSLLRHGGNGLLHFVGHASSDSTDPNVSRFLLSDNRTLRPRDLHGAIRLRIRKDRPLIFINASSVGWAMHWILQCGCGAFVGMQWDVDDASAYLFARTFYGALELGATVAGAVREARLRVREESPGCPAWLAYTAYAHPNARLRLGPSPRSRRTAESS